MANPIEERLVSVSKLISPHDVLGLDQWIADNRSLPPDDVPQAHIGLNDDIEEAIFNAQHKAATLVGLMESPKGRQKTEIIKGLIRSLENDIDVLVCEVYEAHSRSER
jgi:hypothetical protein